MRKQLITRESVGERAVEGTFLDLEALARVEITSEADGHPIEAALVAGRGDGWRADGPGPQKIRILFDEPCRVRRVRLVFEECLVERTQEFTLSWIPSGATTGSLLVRQQYTFSPGGSTRELEDYELDLNGVSVLELEIVPDISRGPALATLAALQVA